MKRYRIPRNKYADHAVQFIDNLSHTGDYSGEPFRLRKWQENIVRLLFGKRDKKKERLIQRAFLLLPRGNGKTELCAAIALYCLFTFPPGQQIVSAGSDREQAARIFDAARQMVENDPYLFNLCEIVPSQKRIVIPDKHSFYAALSSDARRKHGMAPSVVLFDELHTQPNDKLWHALSTAMAKRRSPLWISITTAGVADPHHVAYQEFQLAKRIQDGEVESKRYLPVLYYADSEDDWTDEKVWKKCNPALGDFLNLQVLRDEFEIAKELPSRQNAFRSNHLNQWLQQAQRWLDLSLWDDNAQPVDPKELEGMECWAGLDLAPVRDLSALCLFFKVGDSFKVLPYVWCCEDDIIQRSKRDGAPYDQWAKQGLLKTTPGSSTDFETIRKDINEIANKYHIKEIAADQAHAYQLGQQLSEQDGIPVTWFRQGFISMGPPTARLEKLLIDRRLHHGGHPILRWAAGNVTVETDAVNNMKPSKKKSTERIDPIVALIQSIGLMMADDGDTGQSVYEDRGLLCF